MSIAPSTQTIVNANQKFIIYTSYLILIGGLIGNILNVLVFTCLKLFRGNQSAFYLIVGSIIDCGVLLISFVPLISVYCLNYDLSNISLAWCKIRAMLIPTSILISLSTVCFAAIDQYLSTSHHFSLRQMSTLKSAKRLTCINIVIWILHGIPFGIFNEIRPLIGCDVFNKIFRLYYSIVYLSILNGILPLIITSLFSTLAYHNVRHLIRLQVPIVRRRLDRQLTAMVLIRVAFLIFVSIPFGFYFLYSLNAHKDEEDAFRIAIDQLILTITGTLFLLNYAGSFYLFLFTSRRFRSQVKHLFVKKLWQKHCCNACIHEVQDNRVAPISHVSNLD